jgi:hypothetical protein
MFAVAGAQAQAVYRCGSAYSQTPCAQASVVEVGDARTAGQQTEARRVAADERRLAAEMRRDRLAEQQATRPADAASLSGPAPAKVASSAEPPRSKKKRMANSAPTTEIVVYQPASRKRRSAGA